MLTPDRRASELREKFLAEVSIRLIYRMEPLQAYEAIEELRAHINAMAAAREEVGMEAEKAMRLSLDSFGTARKLGQSIASASAGSTLSPRFLVRQMAPPLLLAATVLVTWAAAFCILDVAVWLFSYLFRWDEWMAIKVARLSVVLALIVSPIAWLLRELKPSAFGLFAVSILNILFGTTIYPDLHTLGGLTEFSFTLTLTMFFLAMATNASIRLYDKRFPLRLKSSRDQVEGADHVFRAAKSH